jgi:hypothetical protein
MNGRLDLINDLEENGGCLGPHHIVAGFTTTYAISAYHH